MLLTSVWEWELMLFGAIFTAGLFAEVTFSNHVLYQVINLLNGLVIVLENFKKMAYEDLISDFTSDVIIKWKSRHICLNGCCQDADICECRLYKSIWRQNSIWQPPLLSMSRVLLLSTCPSLPAII